MIRFRWPLLALVLLLAACEVSLQTEDWLEPGRSISVVIPASGSVYLSLQNAAEYTQLYATSQDPAGVQLRLVLLNTDLNPMLASASYRWFGLPQVAVAGAEAAPAIVVTPEAGARLNLKGYPGASYYLRVENHSGLPVTALVGAEAFEPLADGGLLAEGDTYGAIEFVGEFDTYEAIDAGTLTLSAEGAGASWIVADIYPDAEPSTEKIATLEPGGSYTVEAGYLVIVRVRGGLAAGFNEPESFQYTLSLVAAP